MVQVLYLDRAPESEIGNVTNPELKAKTNATASMTPTAGRTNPIKSRPTILRDVWPRPSEVKKTLKIPPAEPARSIHRKVAVLKPIKSGVTGNLPSVAKMTNATIKAKARNPATGNGTCPDPAAR